MMLRTLLTVSLLAALALPAHSQRMPKENVVDVPAISEGLCINNLFQSNMVLQRDQPIALWGWAAPGENVSVTLDGQTETATAAKDRTWKVTFPARPANADPISIIVKGAKDTLTLENVLVGDVWVLGGQSNMEFELAKVQNGHLEIESAHFPQIRILTVPQGTGPEPTVGFARLHEYSSWSNRHFRKGDWDVCSPETVRELSAIGYVFARRVHMATQVPIGVIDASRGGTTVEAWTPQPVLRKMEAEPVKSLLATWDQKVAEFDPQADLEHRIKRHEQKVAKLQDQGKTIPDDMKAPTDLKRGPIVDANHPGNCYAGMIGPLEGLRVKGAIFHQGFNNCFNGTEGARMYRHVFPEMIRSWRAAFGDPEMPFGILTLCTAGNQQTLADYTESMMDVGAYIRAAQYETYLELLKAGDENIGFTSTYDLSRRWYHPQLKLPAGERIARWALATEYGLDRSLSWKPAQLEEMTVEDGRIALRYDTSVDAIDNGLPMMGFAIAGADRKFHPAVADHLVTGKDSKGRDQKDSKVVVLTSPMVPNPVAYRFAWARNPLANVQKGRNQDIPLPTQRSDDWALEAIPVLPPEETEKLNERQLRGHLKQELRKIDLERRLHEARSLLEEHASE